jgi:transcriptional regulator with GAF, ATPase, and Fis domain
MEAELFGHVRGAYSGAEGARVGLLEAASGGTLFLDEVGELPLALQPKLLGALERRRVTPLGSSVSRPIDVRVVAATNRNLGREVNQKRFRADLFYRLAVVRLRVPPLRERLDDIPTLVEAFLAALRERHGSADVPHELSSIAVARLAAQPWPGNVRELRNAVERAALQTVDPDAVAPPSEEWEPFQQARDRFQSDFERSFLVDVLERSGYNVSQAARVAGVELRYFRRLLQRYEISPRQLKSSE